MAVAVVWFQTYRVDPYSPVKITNNRVRLENGPNWEVFGSDVTTVSPNGIFRVRPVAPDSSLTLGGGCSGSFAKESRIDPICKKTARTVRKFDPTEQSGCFFVLG
ncbi:hypothetical protein CDL15_Pgr013120 [Punica granatum]|uniref:Uncharacterized protein n=1 Tax=Punica granatum TaxID=22663 RepID=A0A218WEL7_PUNGR|nr:hypothetical protein CDL15_Pgr013120 [Punica granatum]PKI38233.1 hypothetical protein CRG98_041372 [Punica granatum]